jgi:hypothetical protein
MGALIRDAGGIFRILPEDIFLAVQIHKSGVMPPKDNSSIGMVTNSSFKK